MTSEKILSEHMSELPELDFIQVNESTDQTRFTIRSIFGVTEHWWSSSLWFTCGVDQEVVAAYLLSKCNAGHWSGHWSIEKITHTYLSCQDFLFVSIHNP